MVIAAHQPNGLPIRALINVVGNVNVLDKVSSLRPEAFNNAPIGALAIHIAAAVLALDKGARYCVVWSGDEEIEMFYDVQWMRTCVHQGKKEVSYYHDLDTAITAAVMRLANQTDRP